MDITKLFEKYTTWDSLFSLPKKKKPSTPLGESIEKIREELGETPRLTRRNRRGMTLNTGIITGAPGGDFTWNLSGSGATPYNADSTKWYSGGVDMARVNNSSNDFREITSLLIPYGVSISGTAGINLQRFLDNSGLTVKRALHNLLLIKVDVVRSLKEGAENVPMAEVIGNDTVSSFYKNMSELMGISDVRDSQGRYYFTLEDRVRLTEKVRRLDTICNYMKSDEENQILGLSLLAEISMNDKQ